MPIASSVKNLNELLEIFPNEKQCIEYLENVRWGSKPISPFDITSEIYKCNNGRYKCKNSNKYFNVKTNTVFEDSKIPMRKWIQAFYIILNTTDRISSYNLATTINITQKSAWYLLQKIDYILSHPNFKNEQSTNLST